MRPRWPGALAATVAVIALAACSTPSPAQEPAPQPAAESAPVPTAVQPTPIAVEPTPVPTQPAPAPPTPAGITVDDSRASPTLVQLVDALDEPEYYCIDVPGFGANLNLQSALMAHTCKPGADDELFAVDHPAPGNLSMPAYDLCLEAEGTDFPARLRLAACSESALQRFNFDADSALVLSGTELCLTVSPGDGEPTGGPSHLRRDLLLLDCAQAEPALSRWALPGPSPQ